MKSYKTRCLEIGGATAAEKEIRIYELLSSVARHVSETKLPATVTIVEYQDEWTWWAVATFHNQEHSGDCP